MNRYTVSARGDLREHLAGLGRETSWSIVAHDMPSVWRKFIRQRFFILGPTPTDYDITLTGKHTDLPRAIA
jgi:hypothetical protein